MLRMAAGYTDRSPAVVNKFAEVPAEANRGTPEALAAMHDREDEVVLPPLKTLCIRAE